MILHCGHCQGQFPVHHPSLGSPEDLRRMTNLSCPWCGTGLKLPQEQVVYMEPKPTEIIRGHLKLVR